MALDEPKEDDEVFRDDGITYVIDRQLFERAKHIHVDLVFLIPRCLRRGASFYCQDHGVWVFRFC